MVVGPPGEIENPFSKEKVIASICPRRNRRRPKESRTRLMLSGVIK
jgi:hypothetical protein